MTIGVILGDYYSKTMKIFNKGPKNRTPRCVNPIKVFKTYKNSITSLADKIKRSGGQCYDCAT